jgi:hypothetical protein
MRQIAANVAKLLEAPPRCYQQRKELRQAELQL